MLYVCFSLSLDLHSTDVDKERREQQTAHLQGLGVAKLSGIERGEPVCFFQRRWLTNKMMLFFVPITVFWSAKGVSSLRISLGL